MKRLSGFFSSKFSSKREVIDPEAVVEEQWIADFTAAGSTAAGSTAKRPSRVRFTITSENSYRVCLRGSARGKTDQEETRGALVLELLKPNCIVWTEDPLFRYRDLAIKGRICLSPEGGYCAAGFMFRMIDDSTYYMALVSSKGYFRLDLVRNRTPLALVGWTEVPGRPAAEEEFRAFDLEALAYGHNLVILINGTWAAELSDSSLSEGRIAFCAANYGEAAAFAAGRAAAEAELSGLSLESRAAWVDRRFGEVSGKAPPENRVRLAETFAALGRAGSALVQLRQAWEDRKSAGGESAAPSELLLAARLALALDAPDEAEGYIEAALAADGGERFAAVFRTLKAELFYARGRYEELKTWANEIPTEQFSDMALLYNLLGHASFNTGAYTEAAAAYDRAFELDGANGLAAKNAAAAYQLAGNRDAAAARYLEAGRIFLEQERYEELGALLAKLRFPGPAHWKVRALAGKWAFALERWEEAETELAAAESADSAESGDSANSGDPPDPAVFYLRALLRLRRGRRKDAMPFLEKAVRYAPEYPLFRFRLAENRFLLAEEEGAPDAASAPALREDLEAALKVQPEEGELYGWIHNFAAQIALGRGDAEKAAFHLENALRVLGDDPAVRINRAVLLHLKGDTQQAFALLEAGDDTGGTLANCAGNLLVREGRLEEACLRYRKALAAAPDNLPYRLNLASCLLELERYGEADETLSAPGVEVLSPGVLEKIAFVAMKKGEYQRAEAALKAALEIEPEHQAARKRLNELRGLTASPAERRIACASCGREWRVPLNAGAVPAIRLYAMPPDDMPAGTCPQCGKTVCIGCGKNALDETGRFTCPECGVPLKLSDEGLKGLLYGWARENLPPETDEQGETQ